MKKIISMLVIASCLLTGTMTFADETSRLSLESASKFLISTNWDLKKIKNIEYQFQNSYEKSVEKSESLSISKIRSMYNRFLGRSLSRYTEMTLMKVEDFYPQMFKYNAGAAHNNYVIAEKGLVIAVRNVYLSVVKADMEVKNNQKKLELAQKKNEQEKMKFESGYITALNMEISDYSLAEAQLDLRLSERNRQNTVRNLNQFIGVQVDERYDEIAFDENVEMLGVQDLKYYIEKALVERLDIKNIEGKIALDKLEMSIMERNNVDTIFRLARNDYAKLKADLETQEINLIKLKIDIEKNIKDAYIDIKKDLASMKILENTITTKENTLVKMKAQLVMGLINSMAVEEIELAVDELKDNLKLAKFNYNTKALKLENAAGTGPAY